jgi:hypothetical protein
LVSITSAVRGAQSCGTESPAPAALWFEADAAAGAEAAWSGLVPARGATLRAGGGLSAPAPGAVVAAARGANAAWHVSPTAAHATKRYRKDLIISTSMPSGANAPDEDRSAATMTDWGKNRFPRARPPRATLHLPSPFLEKSTSGAIRCDSGGNQVRKSCELIQVPLSSFL